MAELLNGIPWKLVLETFFQYILKLFFFLPEYTDVCNFHADTTLHACDKYLKCLISRFEDGNLLAIEWFENNNTMLSQDNCHLIVSGHKYETVFTSVGQSIILETENKKLLGIIIDGQLNFYDYVTSVCKKAGKKLSVLARFSYYMSSKQRKVL